MSLNELHINTSNSLFLANFSDFLWRPFLVLKLSTKRLIFSWFLRLLETFCLLISNYEADFLPFSKRDKIMWSFSRDNTDHFHLTDIILHTFFCGNFQVLVNGSKNLHAYIFAYHTQITSHLCNVYPWLLINVHEKIWTEKKGRDNRNVRVFGVQINYILFLRLDHILYIDSVQGFWKSLIPVAIHKLLSTFCTEYLYLQSTSLLSTVLNCALYVLFPSG